MLLRASIGPIEMGDVKIPLPRRPTERPGTAPSVA